jgi:hypothetical protein
MHLPLTRICTSIEEADHFVFGGRLRMNEFAIEGSRYAPGRWRDTSEACYCRLYYCGPRVGPRKPLLWYAINTLIATIVMRRL